MNTVALIGRLGHATELRTLQSKETVVNISLAVRGCGPKAPTDWFDIVAFGRLADTCRHLVKGQRIAVVGRLRQRPWNDPEGNARRAVEIIASSIDFLDAPRVDADAATETPQA